jgi:DHA2 family multidrug resistance protein
MVPEVVPRQSTTASNPPAAALPPLSVAVQTIGVLTIAMVGASITSQLVDLAIADVGGAFSISADQASWIACIATMAEVAGIPIAAILARALSLRVLALSAAAIFTLCALANLHAADAGWLLIFRGVQSFFDGIISVLLFVAVMTYLPSGAQRNVGLAVFVFASTAPSGLAASVGALFTENFGWRGLYYFDISWSILFLGLAWVAIRPAPRLMRLSEIDWSGYLLLSVGLAALIMFLKQGDRFFWLDNPTIGRAGLVAAIAIPAVILLLLWHRRPLLDLRLLATPTFGWAIVLASFYRFGLVMTAFVVPQVLTRLQSFRLPEIAQANDWIFWGSCVAIPLAWLWASRADARLPLSLGLAFLAVGAYLCTYLTSDWQAGDFRLPMIAIGLGQGFFLLPTLFYATSHVAPQQGSTAAALFNLSRVVGQTFGSAAIGSLITEREKFHSAVLVAGFNNVTPAFTERFNVLVATFLGASGNRDLATLQAWQTLIGMASKEAYVLAFADAFVIVSLVMAASAILVLMLPPLPERTEPLTVAASHGASIKTALTSRRRS